MTPRKTIRRGDWDIELDAWIKTAQVFFFLRGIRWRWPNLYRHEDSE